MRLYVLVEGQTEKEFVEGVLKPHLEFFEVWIDKAIIVETSHDAFGRKRRGGGNWGKWRRDLVRVIRENPGTEVRFTTMFDLYGLPGDFPDVSQRPGDADTVRRAERLEAAMARVVDDHRLIPYIQRHEFEALVLASLDDLARICDGPAELKGVAALKAEVGPRCPEDVNEGRETAPSKRLERHVPSYRKTVHGPLAVGDNGLVALRQACPRFDAWVSRLEGLGRVEP